MSDITDKVIAIVGDQLDVPKEEISRNSSFVDDLKADSLDIVELVMALEDEFEVKCRGGGSVRRGPSLRGSP